MSIDCYWIRNTDVTINHLRDASQGVAMIPLASIESHGPHLPLGCDPIKTDNLVKQIVQREVVAVLPTLHYTYVAAARMLPGAVHVRSDILIDYVECICDDIHRNGFEIVLLHGHGGNTALFTMFADRMLEREKPYAVYSLSAQAGKWDEMRKDADCKEWGHACEWETSMMMMADPSLVTLGVLNGKTFPGSPPPDVGVALTPVDWVARHPEMAVGEPQKATPAKGKKWLEIVTQGVVDHLRLIKKDQQTLAVIRDYIRRSHTHDPSYKKA